MSRLAFSFAVTLAFVVSVRAEEAGLKVPPGFSVTLYADHKLANDIYAMTLDEKGRVLVTSRGWVKRLEDTDGDGIADKETVIVETKSGGMGMCVDDDRLYFCGDGWFSRYRYDGELKKVLNAQFIPLAFTEHGGHAMRKGPDGCFYIIGGNNSEFNKITFDPASPISKPEAGGILRFRKT